MRKPALSMPVIPQPMAPYMVTPERHAIEWKAAVSIEEAAEALSLGRNNLLSLIKEGRLGVVRVGGRVLVPRDEIHSFLNRETSHDVSRDPS
jgi:excisionase family DNA binding protein